MESRWERDDLFVNAPKRGREPEPDMNAVVVRPKRDASFNFEIFTL